MIRNILAIGSGLFLAITLLCSQPAIAATDCREDVITAPTPFMGNNDEVFRLGDGSVWQVKYEYSYLYEYSPSVVICPSQGRLLLKGKSLNVVQIASSKRRPSEGRISGGVSVVLKLRGCRDYFLADGPSGYYLLEWYGGYDPSVGDMMVGDLGSYGFKDVIYPSTGASGRIYVDDYLLSRDRAIQKLSEKCS